MWMRKTFAVLGWTCVLCIVVHVGTTAVRAASGAIPSPEEVFGFPIGADYRLADYSMLLRYFRILDERSDRVQVVEFGRSTRGRPMILAIISAPENLHHLDMYRTIARRLALADVRSEEEARELIHTGKAVVWIDSGLHSTEIAHPQHAIELAYRLAVGDSEEIRRILRDVILLLAPCVNPDGMDLVVHWYREHGNLRIPELYHPYIGHDNNRDFLLMTQTESRAVARVLYREWFPQIVFNHHQQAPRGTAIFVPPFEDPFNFHIDPLVIRGIELVSAAMKWRFEREGKPGVVSRRIFSAWWNGGLRTAAYFHNMIGILTETGIADPAPRKVLPKQTQLRPTGDYPHPLTERTWRLRDSIEYMLTASMGVLDIAARYREQFLAGIYQVARRNIHRGRTEPPYAYVLPADQTDFSRAIELANAMIRAGVRVYRTQGSHVLQDRVIPPGSIVIPTDQPFRPWILDLMEPQVYPNITQYPGGPPTPPYDIAGWTLTYLMDVDVVRLSTPVPPALRDDLIPITDELPWPPGEIRSSTDAVPVAYLWAPGTNPAYRLAFALLREGVRLYRLRVPTPFGRTTYPPGTFLLLTKDARRVDLQALVRTNGVHMQAIARLTEKLDVWELRLPRIALYDTYGGNMDEGWTRWLMEQYGVPYRKVWGGEVVQVLDPDRWDVLILPDGARIGTELEPARGGRMDRTGPLPSAYAMRAPMGASGVEKVRRFVEQGGTLITLGSAAMMAIRDLHVPVENVLLRKDADGRYRPIDRQVFFCPGSVLEAEFDASHPVAYGMPPVGYVFFRHSPTFVIPEGARHRVRVIAQYPDRNPLKSGWIWHPEYIYRKAAIVEVTLGRGRIVLFGPRVQFRALPHGTFKLLWNALLYSRQQQVVLK